MRRLRWNFPIRPPIYVTRGEDGELIQEVVDPETGEAIVLRTRRHYWQGIVWLLVALGVQFMASLVPDVVETVYSRGFYIYLSRLIAVPSKLFPTVVLGEILFVVLIAYFTVWTIWYFSRSFRRMARITHVIKLFFLHALWACSVFFPLFLLVWGLNYQRMPLSETLGLDRRPAARSGELESIGLYLINGVNTNYDRARAGQDWSGASQINMPWGRLNQVIENAFQTETMLGVASQGGYGEPKPLRLSQLATMMGVSGFYISYTAEVGVNTQVPPVDLPMTIAHHKAHQRGFAREDEANFIAFLICAKSADPYVRYSGFMHALRVIEPLSKGDLAKYQDLYSRISPGPKMDITTRNEFWGTAQNVYLGNFSRRIFDMYLRANRVENGVRNYDEDVYLMTSYFLKNLNSQTPIEPASPRLTEPEPPPTLDLTEP